MSLDHEREATEREQSGGEDVDGGKRDDERVWQAVPRVLAGMQGGEGNHRARLVARESADAVRG